jgi:hypothetical protein
MCIICSRRVLMAGTISTLIVGPTISRAAVRNNQIACGFSNNGDFEKLIATMTSMPSGNSAFHRPLIAELQRILQIMPIEPGFRYVDAVNAFAIPDSYVASTKGTVFIGVGLVNKLLEPNDGGISVAGVLAHECSHIFQFFRRISTG